MNRIVPFLGLAFLATAQTPIFGPLQAQERQSRVELGLTPHTIKVDGRERTYRLLVPPRVSEPMPLVFMLHGGSTSEKAAQRVIGYAQFGRIALREKFIVVYPMGVEGNWNDGRGAEAIPAHNMNVDDVTFLRSVVDDVAKKHGVDRGRVFSTGISNGGFMSHRLAAEASDLVAAVAPVVGGMGPEIATSFKPEYAVSVLIIQGNSDPLVPINGGAVGLGRQKNRGQTLKLTEIVQKYLKRNAIKGTPKISILDDDPDDETQTEVTVYPQGEGGAKVHVYVVKNGGHTWPGKRQYLPEFVIGKTSQDFDASEVIWKFFKSCPPRTLTAK